MHTERDDWGISDFTRGNLMRRAAVVITLVILGVLTACASVEPSSPPPTATPASSVAATTSAAPQPLSAPSRTATCSYSVLCPGATTTPAAAGPLDEFATGTFEVGGEVVPGRYRTPGSDSCYWSRIDGNNGQGGGDIIDNYFGPGPQVVTIREGEYFESQRCGVWTLQP